MLQKIIIKIKKWKIIKEINKQRKNKKEWVNIFEYYKDELKKYK